MTQQSSTPDILKDRRRTGGLLSGMRIRKKLLLLHTVISLTMAAVLLVALRPAVTEIISSAEAAQAEQILTLLLGQHGDPERLAGFAKTKMQFASGSVELQSGSADELAIPESEAAAARATPGQPIQLEPVPGKARAVVFLEQPTGGRYWQTSVRITQARGVVTRMSVLMTLSLLALYVVTVVVLELFVLPRHVYRPIEAMLRADDALRQGDRADELIPAHLIRSDEFGQIMRSRNESVIAVRRQGEALADAMDRLELVASDLKKKNHMLETARKNLEGADRLASLGMMSAGIGHELNTPLAVAKGLVERMAADRDGRLPPDDIALLGRVIGRLERLSEGLLTIARVRTLKSRPVKLFSTVEEAITLVRLDRDALPDPDSIEFVNQIGENLVIECDPDRMVQVFVNLVRNSVDAIRSGGGETAEGRITVSAQETEKDGNRWISVLVTDTGPGLDPDMISALFEPFVSTKLDSRGTGLGLAVVEGIVREHHGVVVAYNRPDRTGAIFEVMLPAEASGSPATHDEARAAETP